MHLYVFHYYNVLLFPPKFFNKNISWSFLQILNYYSREKAFCSDLFSLNWGWVGWEGSHQTVMSVHDKDIFYSANLGCRL